jgi:D-beta-D-heptose 7-phosphate kinase/D-beta-D-heptose 1-phosphate adenosyltransferase
MFSKKIRPLEDLSAELAARRAEGARIVFTNGCFDLLHVGHVRYLRQAKRMGDLLLVGINSDASTRRLKGPSRPVQPERDRAEILAALECVDYVVSFDQDTPLALIERLKPDVLVKGADWPVAEIVGREVVEGTGGRVATISYVEGASTSALIVRICKAGTADA